MDLTPTFQPPVLQCTASSWRGPKRGPQNRYCDGYGIGAWNRCTDIEGHAGHHRDSWGHVFKTNPFRVVRVEKSVA